MRAYVTTCCKEKSKILGEIPMMERYISDRIQTIYHKSKEDDVAFFVLSGKYGLLAPSHKIPWYDQILERDQVEIMTKKVHHQLIAYGITEVILFAQKEWETYVDVMKKSCTESNISSFKLVSTYI